MHNVVKCSLAKLEGMVKHAFGQGRPCQNRKLERGVGQENISSWKRNCYSVLSCAILNRFSNRSQTANYSLFLLRCKQSNIMHFDIVICMSPSSWFSHQDVCFLMWSDWLYHCQSQTPIKGSQFTQSATWKRGIRMANDWKKNALAWLFILLSVAIV